MPVLASGAMHCLWLSLIDPEPARNGQDLYSSGLIRSVAAAGVRLDVIALARSGGAHKDGQRQDNILWHLVAGERPRWTQSLSMLPRVARRGDTPAMRNAIRAALASRTYEAVIFDSICAGFALSLCRRTGTGARRPVLLHLAHNHERTAATAVAQATHGPFRRVVAGIDAIKVARLERTLVAQCAVTTSNTPEDQTRFESDSPERPVVLLRPGYDGYRANARAIDGHVPRRAIIVGSFDWPPKRKSLEDFLAAAAGPFARAGLGLQLVGHGDQEFLASLRSRYPTVDVVGPVNDVSRYLAGARIALVPDTLGGFKLKSLDYVFHRVPIFSLAGALPGVPLENGRSVQLFPDHVALARAVIASIDDFPLLNRQHEAAYRACEAEFGWPRIGQQLVAIIRECVTARARVAETSSSRPQSVATRAAMR